MTRALKIFLAAILALILLVLGLLLTTGQWLPRLAGFWLPDDTRIELAGNLRWHDGALFFPVVRYHAQACQLAEINQASLGWHQHRWQLHAADVEINTQCLDRLPQQENADAPRSLTEWQAMLPGAEVQFDKLTVSPWQQFAGRLTLALSAQHQQIDYQSDNLRLHASLSGHTLKVDELSLIAGAAPLTLSGQLNLGKFLTGLPVDGELHARLALNAAPEPINAALHWQDQQGTLLLSTAQDKTPLLTLPWRADNREIVIDGGQWRWPWAAQPLAGNVALRLTDWKQGLAATAISGRLNVLTQGRGGKGNAVLSFGPGHLDLLNSQLPFQLTGDMKLAALQFFAALPGTLVGPLADPLLQLKPGALLRMRGRLLSTLEVDEARWPLAGVSVSSQGVNGRLQAILKAHDPSAGRFSLHLDGGARGFWPDKGRWLWKYWGEGELAPLAAKWDVRGTGSWQETLITLDRLSTGFDQLSYGLATMRAPRLTMTQPIRWQRDAEKPAFSGAVRLDAQETRFNSGGYLPPSQLELALKGSDPARFLFKGALRAQKIGPVSINGRWDGSRLRGQAWWPTQPLSVFQPLLSPDLKMKINSGTLRAQVAFSAAADQGFEAGGHWAVKEGGVWTPDNRISGVDFSLPFRLRAQQWQFGARRPVSLQIAAIENQFMLKNIHAELQGWYPFSEARPLTLHNLSVDLLGGQVSMASLRLPQRRAAVIKLQAISLSELITAIKPKQIALSGRINGELPLWLNHPQWLVKEGWIANSGNLTLRMDKDMADAIASNNIAAGAAIDWLRYMEISRAWATLNLDNLGNARLGAQVQGTSRFSNRDQRVNLNYQQQENLFQLWRSLRFGDNLQSWIEQHASLPTQKENSP